MDPVREEIHGYMDELVPLRRELHRHPELSTQESETTDRLAAALGKLGISCRRMAPSGLSGEIRGTADGPWKTVLLREDMDALPVEEKTGLPFASVYPGRMHACGHDLHMTMLFGALRYLNAHRDTFSGTIRFLFQPAEEISQGAVRMLEQGVMEGVDHAVGMHVSPLLPLGKVSAREGASWAACDRFVIRVHGKNCHGAMPQTGKDALLAASALVMNLQQIVSREADPLTPAVVTVGALHAGTAYNVVAGEAVLEGTCRTFSVSFHDTLKNRMERIASHTAEAYGCTAEVEFENLSEVLYCDPEVTRLGLRSAACVVGEENTVTAEPQMIAEDFSFYTKLAPSVFFNIGARVEDDEKVRPLHSNEVIFQEGAIEIGASVFVRTALDLLASPVSPSV